MFEQIDQLKSQLTDKYVVIDGDRPELRRFRGLTGMVKTVNMSGKALVQFEGRANIGWFDIDPTFLKVIDAPLPKPEAEAKAKPAQAPKAEAKPAAKAEAAKPAAKPAAKGGGMSVEEMMALARGGKGATAAPKPAAKAEAAEKPAAAPKAEKPAGKADPKGLSVEDMLAMARGKKAAPAAEAPAEKKPAAADDRKQAVADAMEQARTKPAPVEAPPAKAAAKPAESKPTAGKLPTDIADIVAFCRQRDAK